MRLKRYGWRIHLPHNRHWQCASASRATSSILLIFATIHAHHITLLYEVWEFHWGTQSIANNGMRPRPLTDIVSRNSATGTHDIDNSPDTSWVHNNGIRYNLPLMSLNWTVQLGRGKQHDNHLMDVGEICLSWYRASGPMSIVSVQSVDASNQQRWPQYFDHITKKKRAKERAGRLWLLTNQMIFNS